MFSRVAFGYPFFSHNRARTNRRTKATKWMSGIMAANYARSHALKHSIVKRKQVENKSAYIYYRFIVFGNHIDFAPPSGRHLNARQPLYYGMRKWANDGLSSHAELVQKWTVHTSLYPAEPTKPQRNHLLICCVPNGYGYLMLPTIFNSAVHVFKSDPFRNGWKRILIDALYGDTF